MSSRESSYVSVEVMGGALAMIMSYSQWHSIGWALLHGLLGWFYVAYCAFAGQR